MPKGYVILGVAKPGQVAIGIKQFGIFTGMMLISIIQIAKKNSVSWDILVHEIKENGKKTDCKLGPLFMKAIENNTAH